MSLLFGFKTIDLYDLQSLDIKYNQHNRMSSLIGFKPKESHVTGEWF
jgi:hypothetical protein